MKKLLLLLTLTAFQQDLFAQGVGINTTSPDPSAALDIQSTNKGILIPKVALKDLTDKTTIVEPANSLMVYNTNAALKYGVGYYYNAGTSAAPSWMGVSQFTMPYYYGGSDTNPLFQVDNYNNTDVGLVAIKGYGAGNNTGVYAKSDSRFALEVDGRMKIFGNGQTPGVGKVLTSGSSGIATWEGAVGFSTNGVQGGGGQIVAPNTEYKIPFSTLDYDLSNNYNEDDTFTAPVNGIYHFDCQIIWGGGGGDEFTGANLKLIRLRNGSKKILLTTSDGGSVSGINLISTDTNLLQGDIVYVAIIHSKPGNISLQATTDLAFFNGRLVVRQ